VVRRRVLPAAPSQPPPDAPSGREAAPGWVVQALPVLLAYLGLYCPPDFRECTSIEREKDHFIKAQRNAA
jgi:hypothetical protein